MRSDNVGRVLVRGLVLSPVACWRMPPRLAYIQRALALLLATSCAGDVLAFSLPTHVLRRGAAAGLRAAADNTHYEAIGVGKQASASEVRTAYLKLAKRLHPDVSKDPADTARFKRITEAYDVLSDSRLRSEYDQVLFFVCLELTRQRLPLTRQNPRIWTFRCVACFSRLASLLHATTTREPPPLLAQSFPVASWNKLRP